MRTEEDSQCDLQSLGFLMTKQTLSLHFSLPYFSEIKEKATVKQSMPSSSHLVARGWLGGTKSFAIIHVAASCGECGLCKVHRLRSPSFRLQATARHASLVCPRLRPLVWVGQTWVRHCPHLPHNICTPGSFPKQGKAESGGRL